MICELCGHSGQLGHPGGRRAF